MVKERGRGNGKQPQGSWKSLFLRLRSKRTLQNPPEAGVLKGGVVLVSSGFRTSSSSQKCWSLEVIS